MITLGNHEFDHVELLSNLTAQLEGKFISSNVFQKQKTETNQEGCNNTSRKTLPNVKPYKIITLGGKRILFLGLTTTNRDCMQGYNIAGYIISYFSYFV